MASLKTFDILYCNTKKLLKLKTFISKLLGWDVLTIQPHFSIQIKPWQTHPVLLDWSGTAYFSRAQFQQNSPNQFCLRAIPITKCGGSTTSLFASAQLCFSSAFPKVDKNQLWVTGFFAVGLDCSNSKSTRSYFYSFSRCKGLFLLFSL